MLKVKLFYPDAIVPKRQTADAAGYDLYAYNDVVIPPLEYAIVNTGIGITVPPGTYGRIAPRSSLSLKKIFVNAGIIDRDYTNSIKIILQNFSIENFRIAKGDRIAQLILEQIRTPEIEIVEELEITDRGLAGFGSTGK